MDTRAPIEPFGYRSPATDEVPLVVSIPHTGTYLPEAVGATLASDAMRGQPMTDWHLHRLYDFLPELGAHTVYATYSRFVIDLNRGADARPLYPGRFETGLVPKETFQGERVYATPPDAEEIERRRQAVHAPYHGRLQELLDDCRARFGRVVLIDAHSVASRASRLHGELQEDIYLGNRDGATCSDALIGLMKEQFEEHDQRVSLNHPYKGGYITDHYGRLDGVEALQIEMCQRVYMDEDDPTGALQEPRFAETKAMLREIFAALTTAIQARRV